MARPGCRFQEQQTMQNIIYRAGESDLLDVERALQLYNALELMGFQLGLYPPPTQSPPSAAFATFLTRCCQWEPSAASHIAFSNISPDAEFASLPGRHHLTIMAHEASN